MDDWKRAVILPDTTIKKTIELIDKNALQIAIVADRENRLLGTVTDGDIRRGILSGIQLSQPVERIMNKRPISIPEIREKAVIRNILRLNKIRHLPVVDSAGHIIGVETLEDFIEPPETAGENANWVVILAGGLGKRLRPLTDDCPKPMLRIGERPVLETMLVQFIRQGYDKFCLSLNYQAEKIRSYFGDGSKWGVRIEYIFEEQFMGTAGSLSLFSQDTDKSIIVINGDILTRLNFRQLADFHFTRQAQATVAVAAYGYQIPYGVVKINKDRLAGFEEKPVFESFINAGIYVLNADVLKLIPKNTCFDMNHVLEKLLENGEKVCIFPVREYWIDIGSIEDFNKAKSEFDENFR
jgi:Nucleoside-diphosphate-sugar pyrophosphorylase involved in lipopolysaccharide biosynthesis/translation initiation factor 2B, gamma/epsilon subunits (eIF-2Bgamma/eIF-2Bepsilon)